METTIGFLAGSTDKKTEFYLVEICVEKLKKKEGERDVAAEGSCDKQGYKFELAE